MVDINPKSKKISLSFIKKSLSLPIFPVNQLLEVSCGTTVVTKPTKFSVNAMLKTSSCYDERAWYGFTQD
jgi:hypothetical protein